MKKLAMWNIVLMLSFSLVGCGKCEHEYDNGVITKESTSTKEGEKIITCEICGYSYIESLPIIESKNQKIYEQMVELCNSEEYMQALIVGKDAVEDIECPKDTIDEFARKIISDNFQYIKEEVKYAIENSDFKILDTLYYYRRGLDKEQVKVYEFYRDLQGVYRNIKDPKDEIEIIGIDLKIGAKEYVCKYEQDATDYEYGTQGYSFTYFKPIFLFEDGKIEKSGNRFIKITYTDGTCCTYESDEMKKKDEEEKKQKEQEYLENEPRIGMTADEVKKSNWGNPQDINKTTYAWGVTEQWCYPNYRYIYFEDGIVTAIQE